MKRLLRRLLATERGALLLFLVAAVVLTLLGALIINAVNNVRFSGRVALCKQNLHAVQLAIERFSVDSSDGNYPARLDVLQAQGYLDTMPHNPFSGAPMRYVECDSAPPAVPPGLGIGDFAYIRLGPDGGPPRGSEITGYSLVLY
jgi:hypothetical protein